MSLYQQLVEETSPRGRVTKQLWRDVAAAARSGNAIARVVHGEHARRWNEDSELELLNCFDAAQTLISPFSVATSKQKDDILRHVAIKVKRSPMAVSIRLKQLGIDLSRRPPTAEELVAM